MEHLQHHETTLGVIFLVRVSQHEVRESKSSHFVNHLALIPRLHPSWFHGAGVEKKLECGIHTFSEKAE